MNIQNNTNNISLSEFRIAENAAKIVIANAGYDVPNDVRIVADNLTKKKVWSGMAFISANLVELHFAEDMRPIVSTKKVLGSQKKRIPLYSKQAAINAAMAHELAHIAVKGIYHDLVKSIEAEAVMYQMRRDNVAHKENRVLIETQLRDWLGWGYK